MDVTACFDPKLCEFHKMGGHFPVVGLYRPYSLGGFFVDLSIYGLMLPVTISAMLMVCGMYFLLSQFWYSGVSVIISCGERALLALVLNAPVVEMLSVLNVRRLTREVPDILHPPILLLTAIQMNLMLSSTFTASLLEPLAVQCSKLFLMLGLGTR